MPLPIRTSSTPTPPWVIIYGPPGCGKTVCMVEAGALILAVENGANTYPSAKYIAGSDLDTWPKIVAVLDEIAASPEQPAPIIAIDTLDWLVEKMKEYILDLDGKRKGDITNTMITAHGGYAKAKDMLGRLVWLELIEKLNRINDRGMAIVLLSHATHTKMTDPEGNEVHTAAPDLDAKTVLPVFLERSQGVFYMRSDVNGQGVVTREMQTMTTPRIIAKNRWNMPPIIPYTERGEPWKIITHFARQAFAAPKSATGTEA